jgi:hypothetical protein
MSNVSNTSLFNSAIDRVGGQSIGSATEDSKNAKVCRRNWDSTRRTLLRLHPWRFAISRIQLAPLADVPPFGDFQFMFAVPQDYIKMIKPVTANNTVDPLCDWQLERYNGRRVILSNNCFPTGTQTNLLNLRYVADVTSVPEFDPLFYTAAYLSLADDICEKITSSTQKKNSIQADYKDAISEAKKANCFEMIPQDGQQGSYDMVRTTGALQ